MKRGFTLNDFYDWRWPMSEVFPLTTTYGNAGTTCGSAALAMIVNRHPNLIERRARRNVVRPFDEFDMKRTLAKYGFEAHLFSGPQGLVNLGKDARWASDELSHRHMLLFSADTTKEEASWFVAFGGVIYHNGMAMSSSPLFGLTNPMIDLLLVRRKKKR